MDWLRHEVFIVNLNVTNLAGFGKFNQDDLSFPWFNFLGLAMVPRASLGRLLSRVDSFARRLLRHNEQLH